MEESGAMMHKGALVGLKILISSNNSLVKIVPVRGKRTAFPLTVTLEYILTRVALACTIWTNDSLLMLTWTWQLHIEHCPGLVYPRHQVLVCVVFPSCSGIRCFLDLRLNHLLKFRSEWIDVIHALRRAKRHQDNLQPFSVLTSIVCLKPWWHLDIILIVLTAFD